LSVRGNETEREQSKENVNVDRPFWKKKEEGNGEHTENEKFGADTVP
jgi:hypothetical protein